MSEQATQKMRYHLAIRQGVDRQMNELVVNARKLVDGFLEKEKQGGRWEMGPTQMSNLLNVCGETESVEVVIGYIQYQIGRDKGSKGPPKNWAWQGFGEELVKRLQDLKSQAGALVSTALQKAEHTLDEDKREEEEDRVWMLLVRQYVGHLRRYFTYKRPKKEGR
ncbi:MAG: hypothetical protein DRI79_13090 [Chloroflexi bacterium]|nr:MAG: hypothetical protein DRI79_13090 [Chloroflexota bacterium]